MEEPDPEGWGWGWRASSLLAQRRLRHLDQVLVRNLGLSRDASAAAASSHAQDPFSLIASTSRLPPIGSTASVNSGSGSSLRDSDPFNDARTSLDGSGDTPSKRPGLSQRTTSRDDLDLQLPSLQAKKRASQLRRKRTVSGNQRASADPKAGHVLASPAEHSHLQVEDGKGKQRAAAIDWGDGPSSCGLGSSRAELQTVQDRNVNVNGEDDETDVVFAWTSGSTIGSNTTPSQARVTRSRSGSSSAKSNSSRPLSSSVSRRLFRSSHKPARTDPNAENGVNDNDHHRANGQQEEHGEEGDEDAADDDDPRGDRQDYERRREMDRSLGDIGPLSPLAHRVSFQLDQSAPFEQGVPSSESHQSTLLLGPPGGLGSPLDARRARSASRSSAFSIASGSSASTVRPSASSNPALLRRHSYKVDEARWRRSNLLDNVRTRLVRSCITIGLPLYDVDSQDERNNHSATPRTSAPIFVSSVHPKSTQPAFYIDRSRYNVQPAYKEAVSRSERVVISLWIERSLPSKPGSNRTRPSGGSWMLLTEWDIDLRGLVSLGSDPLLFPENLPKNTLILKLSNSDEYWTSPLPPLPDRDFVEEREGDIQEEQEGLLQAAEDLEDAGTISDPGTTSTRTTSHKASQQRRLRGLLRDEHSAEQEMERQKREKERRIARQKMILERSMRETRMQKGIDDEYLQYLLQLVAKRQRLSEEIRSLQEHLDATLGSPPFEQERNHSYAQTRVSRREEDLRKLSDETEATERRKQRKIEDFARRRKRLQAAWDTLEDRRKALYKAQAEYNLDGNVCSSIALQAAHRRAYLVSELSNAFPVEPLDSASLVFTICEIPLVPSTISAQDRSTVRPPPHVPLDDDTLASALGYTAQALQLLGAYLGVPLHYPVRCIGSRSLVEDPISQIKGPKLFPLYTRGVERYRFEYAVFLLNKDIEQLMLEYGIVVLDLRQTLPNLKNLYLTLSTQDRTRPNQLLRNSTLQNVASGSFPSTALHRPMNLLSLSPSLSASPSTSSLAMFQHDQSSDTLVSSTGNARSHEEKRNQSAASGASAAILEKILQASTVSSGAAGISDSAIKLLREGSQRSRSTQQQQRQLGVAAAIRGTRSHDT